MKSTAHRGITVAAVAALVIPVIALVEHPAASAASTSPSPTATPAVVPAPTLTITLDDLLDATLTYPSVASRSTSSGLTDATDLLGSTLTTFLELPHAIAESVQELADQHEQDHAYRLTAASSAPGAPVVTAITDVEADAALQSAIADWVAVLPEADLSAVTISVIDLPDLELARATGTAIEVDVDAAQWGWSVSHPAGELGHMDLATVLRHELGHLLGLDHTVGELMDPTLEADEVRAVTVDDAESLLPPPPPDPVASLTVAAAAPARASASPEAPRPGSARAGPS